MTAREADHTKWREQRANNGSAGWCADPGDWSGLFHLLSDYSVSVIQSACDGSFVIQSAYDDSLVSLVEDKRNGMQWTNEKQCTSLYFMYWFVQSPGLLAVS